MRLLLTVFFLSAFIARAGAAAPPASPPVLTPAQAQSVLDVLKDDKARAQFTAVLESMVKAAPAAEAAASPLPLAANSVGAALLVQGSSWASQLGKQLRASAQAIGNVPALWNWMYSEATDEDERARFLDAGWKLAVVLAAARAVEWLARRALRSSRGWLEKRAPADEPIADDAIPVVEPHRRGVSMAWRLLRRLPFVFGGLMLDLVPVAVFAAMGNALLATPLGDNSNARLVILAIVNAYVLSRIVMCIVRAFVAPHTPRLRLLQCDDYWARYIERWARRITAVAVFGFAAAEVGVLFGLYSTAHDMLIKLVGLVVHTLLIVVVVQSRHAVANRLRAPRRKTGTLASLQNHLATRWHVIAIFYIVALWLVAAAEIRDGYTRLLHFFVVTSATLIVARLAGIVLLGALDRALRVKASTPAQFPAFEQRLSHYYPVVRLFVTGVLSAVTGVVLLEVWGYSPVSWFSGGQLGAQLLSAVATSAVTILVAVVAWEAANAAIEGQIATLTRAAQTARAARLRTLLPMLRTALLGTIVIIAGLIVLSQIGVNIAPLLAGAGVLGVAIGFGSQKLVQDLITGLFLLLENTMQVGDIVSLGGLSGTVEYLSIRTIRLRALDGSLHIIPFSSVTTVTNQTRDFAYALVDLPIGLNEEPDRVGELLRAIVSDMRAEPRWKEIITAELDVMGVYAFTDTAWTMRVRIRCTPSQRWAVNREFNRRVKYCFDQNAVQSPITAYKVQGFLPPGAERSIPPPPPPPLILPEAAQ